MPPLTNTGNTKEGQFEVSLGHPCLEVLMENSTGEGGVKACEGEGPLRDTGGDLRGDMGCNVKKDLSCICSYEITADCSKCCLIVAGQRQTQF